MATPPLRPLTFGEILSAAGNLYKQSWQTFVPAVLAVVIPVELVNFVVLVATVPDPALVGGSFGGGVHISGGDWALYAVGQLAVVLVAVVAQALVTAALFRVFSERYFGLEPTWQESLRFALSRIGSVVWISVLVGLVAIVGVLACIVGVIATALFALAAFSTAIPVMLVEDLRGTKAMRRSWELVKPDFWWVLGLLLVATLIVFAGAFVLGLVTGVIGTASDSIVVSAALRAITNLVVYTVASPFVGAVVAILYFDLRVRREGLDPAAVVQTLRGSAPEPQPPAPAI